MCTYPLMNVLGPVQQQAHRRLVVSTESMPSCCMWMVSPQNYAELKVAKKVQAAAFKDVHCLSSHLQRKGRPTFSLIFLPGEFSAMFSPCNIYIMLGHPCYPLIAIAVFFHCNKNTTPNCEIVNIHTSQ